MPVLLLVLQAVLAPSINPDPFAFFRPSFAPTADERRQLDRGDPLARALSAANQEVAVFAAVPIDINGDRLAAWMRRIAALKKSSYVPAIGRFSDPPRIGDLADLALDDGDLSDLRQCRPRECGLKLSKTEIEQLPGVLAKAGANWKPALQDGFRQIVLRRVQAYLAGGHAALDPYENDGHPVSLASRFSVVLQHSGFLSEHLPQLAGYLDRYPRASLQGAESLVYWSKERIGPRAVIRVTHLTILRGTGDLLPEVLVAGKEIFATHYLNASLGITAITPGKPGARRYLVYVNRAEVDNVGGFFGGVVRWFVERRLKSEANDVLAGLRRRLESGEPPP